jgi:hypothetical protein
MAIPFTMNSGFVITALSLPRSPNSQFSIGFEWLVMQLSTLHVLSSEQIEIFHPRHAGVRYTKIQSMFSLSNPTALTRCLVRTALGFFWCHYHAGRGDCH